MEKDAFGRFLRREREDRDKTMGDLARHLGISVSHLSSVERGTYPPFQVRKILEIAAFLEMDPDPLLVLATECYNLFTSLPN